MPEGIDDDFVRFYEKYITEIVLFITKVVHNFDTAEDLAQDVFMKVYKRRHKIEFCSPGARKYLYKTVNTTIIDHSRSERSREERHRKSAVEVDMDDAFYSDVEDMAIEGEVISTVSEVLEEFPESSRRIFTERFIEQKKLREISDERKISFYKIRKIEEEVIRRLRHELRFFFEEET